MDAKKLGSKIRLLRRKEGLTLDQLSIAVNIKKNMLSNYELGKSAISTELLSRIADYFGTSLDYLTDRHTTYSLGENFDDNKMVKIPVYTFIHTSDIEDEINLNEVVCSMVLPGKNFTNGTFFGLTVTDNSINRKISKESVAIIRKQNVAKPGELVVYTYGDDIARFGVYHFTGENVIISPFSTDESLPPAIFPVFDSKFQILGKVIMSFGPVIM